MFLESEFLINAEMFAVSSFICFYKYETNKICLYDYKKNKIIYEYFFGEEKSIKKITISEINENLIILTSNYYLFVFNIYSKEIEFKYSFSFKINQAFQLKNRKIFLEGKNKIHLNDYSGQINCSLYYDKYIIKENKIFLLFQNMLHILNNDFITIQFVKMCSRIEIFTIYNQKVYLKENNRIRGRDYVFYFDIFDKYEEIHGINDEDQNYSSDIINDIQKPFKLDKFTISKNFLFLEIHKNIIVFKKHTNELIFTSNFLSISIDSLKEQIFILRMEEEHTIFSILKMDKEKGFELIHRKNIHEETECEFDKSDDFIEIF